MTEAEVFTIIEYFGGEILKLSTVVERFFSARLEKCKEVYVSKEEILLLMIDEWTLYQSSQVLACEKLVNMPSYIE